MELIEEPAGQMDKRKGTDTYHSRNSGSFLESGLSGKTRLILGAKLLKDVEKSYDPEKNHLIRVEKRISLPL